MKELTTINIQRSTFRTMLDIKYDHKFKSMDDVVLFLLKNNKNKK